MAYDNTTYYVNLDENRIVGKIDDFEAARQAIEKLLVTEQYTYMTYNYEYGVGLKKLIGKPLDYIKAKLPSVIEKQLKQDDRVNSVSNYRYKVVKNKLYVDFDVSTIYNSSSFSVVVDYK